MSVRRRSAKSLASNGFLNVSLMAERSNESGLPSSGNNAIRIVSPKSTFFRRFWQICRASTRPIEKSTMMQSFLEAFRLDAGFEAAGRDADFALTFDRQLAPQVFDQDLVLSHASSTLAMASSSLFAKGHPVFLQELDQVFAGYATVLRAGD